MKERPDCPHCGRPMGFEYRAVEKDKCQLWRWFHEGGERDLSPRTIADCFGLTSRRLKALTDELEDTRATLRAAQRALSRRHDAATAATEPFRDGARIE